MPAVLQRAGACSLCVLILSGDGPAPGDRDGGVPQVAGVHLVAEAERLAYADRDKYVADTDFVPLPGGSPAMMLDKAYLEMRSTLISTTASLGTAPRAASESSRRTAPRSPSSWSMALPITATREAHYCVVDGSPPSFTITRTATGPMASEVRRIARSADR